MSLNFFRNRQPSRPTERVFSVPCTVEGARGELTIDPPPLPAKPFPQHVVTCAGGKLTFNLPANAPLGVGGWLRVTAEGFQPATCRVKTPLTPTGTLQLWSVEPNAPMADQRVVLTPAASYPPESGLITVHDRQFWTEDGRPWTWAGMTDFLLFARFLFGQDITPQLKERRELGAKVLRVFSMVDAFSKSRPEPFAHLYPQEHADYHDKLHEWVLLVNGFGMRVELTVYADAGTVMKERDAQDDHAERCFVAVETAGRSLGMTNMMEGGNETNNESNLPGREARAFEIMKRFQGRSPYVLVASGASMTDLEDNVTEDAPFVLDYVTEHLDRGDEWPRKHIDLALHRDGFTWKSGKVFKGTQSPTVSDESRALDETKWGSRTTDVIAAGQAGAMGAMFGGGITFHSQSGLLSELLGPIQYAGAKAMLTAARFIPAAVQLLPYARGSDQGPCSWAYGESPVEHQEGPGKRSFAKWIGNDYWIVRCGATEHDADGNEVNNTNQHVVACSGFTLVDEPVLGVAHLRRQ